MAAVGLVALFRSCMDNLKSILTSQKFGYEYELSCTELSLQLLRFHLWGNSVGIHVEAIDSSHSPIISRQDLRPTFDQALSSIAYLLKETEEIRQKYRLNRLPLSIKADAKVVRSSKSSSALSSFRSTFALQQRMRENQRQKSFLAIARWAIRDSKKFDEKVEKLKRLIDGLEDVTKSAGFSDLGTNGSQSTSALSDENPPPYSAAAPLTQPLDFPAERAEQVEPLAIVEHAIPTYNTLQQASLWTVLLKYIPVMKASVSACPDRPRAELDRVLNKFLALSHQQFRELSEDIYNELLRRQRHDDPIPEWLSPKASLYTKRSEARRMLSTLHVIQFSHLVIDIVFEFERRFPEWHARIRPPHPETLLSEREFSQLNHRWGLCVADDPPSRLQYRAAHQSNNIDPAYFRPMIRVPTSSSSMARNFSRH